LFDCEYLVPRSHSITDPTPSARCQLQHNMYKTRFQHAWCGIHGILQPCNRGGNGQRTETYARSTTIPHLPTLFWCIPTTIRILFSLHAASEKCMQHIPPASPPSEHRREQEREHRREDGASFVLPLLFTAPSLSPHQPPVYTFNQRANHFSLSPCCSNASFIALDCALTTDLALKTRLHTSGRLS